jgi:hypothetical protein
MDVLEAIDRLTEQNRIEPDTDTEARLIALRHDAFAVMERPRGFPDWPRTDITDRFNGVDGPPEVDASELSGDVVASGVVGHGALLVRNLIDEARVERLVAAIEAAFAAYDAAWTKKAPVAETAPWFVPFEPNPPYDVGSGRRWVRNGGGVWTVDSPRAFFELSEIIRDVGLDEVIAQYLGERPALSARKSTLRRVPLTSGTDWHQDGAFLGKGIRTLNVWLSLSHCGEDAPGLDIVPARMPAVLETGTHGAQFDWSVGPGLVEEVAGPNGVVSPVFAPGDALLFDELFLHRTGIRPDMTRERYAIESWFFAPSAYPDEQIPVVF